MGMRFWDMKLKIHLMSPKAGLLFFLLSFFFLIFLLHLLFHPWPKYPPLVNQNKHENTWYNKKTSWILAEGCLRSCFLVAHTIPLSHSASINAVTNTVVIENVGIVYNLNRDHCITNSNARLTASPSKSIYICIVWSHQTSMIPVEWLYLI